MNKNLLQKTGWPGRSKTGRPAGQPAMILKFTGRVGSGKSWPVPSLKRAVIHQGDLSRFHIIEEIENLKSQARSVSVNQEKSVVQHLFYAEGLPQLLSQRMSKFVAGILNSISSMVNFSEYRSLIQFMSYQGHHFFNLALHIDNQDLKHKFSIFAITLRGWLLSTKKKT